MAIYRLASIRGFSGILLYWCHIVGVNLEQNIVVVTLVVQNFLKKFVLILLGCLEVTVYQEFMKLGKNESFLLPILYGQALNGE